MSSRVSWLAVLLTTLFAPALFAEPGKGLWVIEASRVITVTGEEYTPGMIVIEDGEITLVGQNLDVPSSARRIRARGETVMPGMVLATTRLGLGRGARNGVFTEWNALDEVHPEEIDGEPFVEAGFVAVTYVPPGSGFSGQAGVVRPPLDDEAEVLRRSAYIPVSMTGNSRDRGRIAQAFDRAQREIEKAKKAKEEWDKKQAAAKKKAEEEEKAKQGQQGKPPQRGGGKPSGNPAEKKNEKAKPEKPAEFVPPRIPEGIKPLVAILREDADALPLVFSVSNAGNLLHLAEAIDAHKPLKAALHRNVRFNPSSRAEQRPMVELLGEQEATAIMAPVITNLPSTLTRVSLPGELARAGARLIFVPTSDTRAEFLRLRARVADLIRAGLPREVGLRALTENPAQFLGIADRCGAIEKGRSADLIFLDGDPFDAATRVTRTMIAGEVVWEEGE